jgi:hypothetical protein
MGALRRKHMTTEASHLNRPHCSARWRRATPGAAASLQLVARRKSAAIVYLGLDLAKTKLSAT